MIVLKVFWLIASIAWLFVGGAPLFKMQEFNIITEEFFIFAIGCAVLCAPKIIGWIRKFVLSSKGSINWVTVAIAVIGALLLAPVFFVVAFFANIFDVVRLFKQRPHRAHKSSGYSQTRNNKNSSMSKEEFMRKRYLETTEQAILKIYDENDSSDVFIDDGEKSLWLEQTGLLVYEGEHYALLTPRVTNSDGERVTLVYCIIEDADIGGYTLKPILDEALYTEVIRAFEEEK